MPLLIEASILRRQQKVSAAKTYKVNALPAGTGPTPNGNTILLPANGRRVSATIRNVRDLLFPGATDQLRFGYNDDPNLATNGFILEPNESFEILSPEIIYCCSTTGNQIPVSIDEGNA